MLETAPGVIRRFMDAAERRDYEAIGECFTEDATVEDEERTHRGRTRIRGWQQETRSKWDYTLTVVGGEQAGASEYRVAAHLKGNFPGGEADLQYWLSLREGLISSLRIT